MLNVRGSTPGEFDRVLTYVSDNIQRIAGLGDVIRAAEAATSGGLASPTPTPSAAPAPVPTAQPAPDPASAPVCRHGQKTWRPPGIAGPRAKNPGKPYDGFWACPSTNRNDQCKPWE